MKLTRRDFLKLSGATAGALLASSGGLNLIFADETYYLDKKIVPDAWKKAVCRYCGTGCGMQIGLKSGKVVAMRGDKDYPVNKGVLCLKGLSLMYVVYSKERALKPYLKKNDQFIETDWDSAVVSVAQKIKSTVEKHGPDSVALYVGAQILPRRCT